MSDSNDVQEEHRVCDREKALPTQFSKAQSHRAHRVFERQEMQQRGLVLVTQTLHSSSGGGAAFHSLMLPSNRIGMKGSPHSGLRCAYVGKGLLCQAPNQDYALHLMWLMDVPTDMNKPCQPECCL